LCDYCSVNGLAYDPSLRTLYVGCDQYYYNRGLLLILKSPNAFASNSATVIWEECHRFGQSANYGIGAVIPLAVDARDRRTLYVSVSESVFSGPSDYSVQVSHDNCGTWETLSLRGLAR
jgi:hypothetical protein